ncbi:acylneuraminate cytidylyltransferase family protein [Calidifontibacter sp. DB0510]|uniref:Acylneuraminate cytidylyltransferase family protein n=1 Tax=Metallococcus carri TaxID=1656884 RepID=A0A967B0K1_9MICO|nr:acylneuraminate cytidylyltransferase family protein [Metallococcus carri]NHN56571.1 acylneuraminate cytidylyltransferase family protein [Metallococcus carri]NOP38870.1 acylneuraminate cytidylyltransferase family protein [Calidifontibacter sp. DB2511S]
MITPAIIPARGGSKGVPRKNLKPLGGKPLISWTIEQVLATEGLVPYVSTEDDEIAEIAAHAGAQVIRRPDDLAQDTTASEPVIGHAIAQLPQRPERVMFLQVTSPIRLEGTLARMLREFDESGVDSMVGVVPAEIFLWQKEPEVRPLYPYTARPRRQDMAPDQLRYRETGSAYLTRTDIYEREHNRLGGRIGLFVMDPVEGLDIDTVEDFALAEFLVHRGQR